MLRRFRLVGVIPYPAPLKWNRTLETTEHYKSLHNLKTSQLLAIEALISGSDHQGAADKAGVHRVTISNWVNHHPGFIAELNRKRLEILSQRDDQIRKMDALALTHLMNQFEAGDDSAIQMWIKARGLAKVDTSEIGITDSEAVVQIQVERRAHVIQEEYNNELLRLPSAPGSDKKLLRMKFESELVELLDQE